jgi:methylthioribose-1-phosphate isomerase
MACHWKKLVECLYERQTFLSASLGRNGKLKLSKAGEFQASGFVPGRQPASMVLQAIQYVSAIANSAPSLRILDQLQLPHRTEFITIDNIDDAHAAIKQMKVRGAPAIAIVAALSLAVVFGRLAYENNLPTDPSVTKARIYGALHHLQTSRPTAVNLSDAVRKLENVAKTASLEEGATSESIAKAYIAAAERMLVDDVSDNKAIGEHGARWIEKNTVAGRKRKADRSQKLQVLTHCNTG